MSRENQFTMDFIAGQLAGESVERSGNALFETMAGNGQLLKVWKQYQNCSAEINQGRMFEYMESTKFNAAAARAGKTLRAVTTEQLGMPWHKADIFIRDQHGNILKQIQAKSGNKASGLARAVSNPKYKNMDRLVNKDHQKKVKELIRKRMNSKGIFADDYKKAHGYVKGRLEYGKVKSKGTTYDEALKAAKNPEAYVKQQNTAVFLSGAGYAMASGALAGAFVGTAASSAQSAFKGEFCVKETGKAAANSASRGAMISGVSFGLKYIGKNHPVMSGSVVSAMASSAVCMTELSYQYLKGTISSEEYLQGLGSNSVSCFTGIIMTAAGAAMFGPIGAAVAGTVGLLGMKQLYKCFITATEDVQLAKEERIQAEALSTQLIQLIKEEQQLLVDYYEAYAETLAEVTAIVKLAIMDDSFTEQSIVSLAAALNVTFEYENLADFNDFMLSEDSLKL